ncbi:lipase family alpha/beta hydrolase [Halomarina rubra]|uniref:Lipase family alpha/beta hydrolase n=1 Tax=Halomarina rubra TaxID=2071873 RepID=A0ABD6AQ03_9EURY|nr:alpha/beta hydrolase [Halomarina rubra]
MGTGETTHPVLLVHGYGDAGATPWWRTLEGRFHNRGYPDDAVETLSFGVPGLTLGSPRRYAERIGDRVETLRDRYDSRVDIVAHSMGGLGARWYVERGGGAAFVDDLVTLGTPHQGTTLAYTQPTPGGRAMTPDSDFLTVLNGRRPPRGVDYTAVGSDDDGLVSPDRASLPFEARNVRNVHVSGPGHMALVSDAGVFSQYADAL